MSANPTTRLAFEKETKNTYRYDAVADGEPPAIDNAYIKKWALGEDPPEMIDVDVTAVDPDA